MSYTLKIHGERIVYQVPPGLYELMSDISREVLRDQPDQLYNYIADYMDTLLKLRSRVKNATDVVNDTIDDSQELLAYVTARGMTLEEANRSARVIQRAFRGFKNKKEFKEMLVQTLGKDSELGTIPISEYSSSFVEYFDSLGIEYEKANNASYVIQSAFKSFIARKKMEEMVRCSTHSINLIQPTVDVPVPLVFEKPIARISKLQVYEESPSPSINSGWYKPVTDETAGAGNEKRSVASSATSVGSVQKRPFARDSELLVFEQFTRPSIDTVWYAACGKFSDVSMEARRLGLTKGMSFLERDDSIPKSAMEYPVPTYFEADQSRVPMVSESGQLEVSEDVVTLFSTDSFKFEKSFISPSGGVQSQLENVEKISSLQSLTMKVTNIESEAAKEMFNIIERKPSGKRDSTTGSLQSPKSVQMSLEQVGASMSHGLLQESPSWNISASSQTSNKTHESLHPRKSSRMIKLQVQHSSEDFDSEEEL